MTEVEWLTETDFAAHVQFAAKCLSPRRLRLLAAGFCRAVGPLLDHPTLTEALAVVEQYADGAAAPADVERARQRCRDLAAAAYEAYRGAVDRGALDGLHASVRSELGWAVAFATNNPLPADEVGGRAAQAAAQARTGAVLLAPVTSAAFDAAITEQDLIMRSVVWEVAGNPFRPVAFSREWRTDTARALARQMYDSREFGAMPILADALQDAGCDNDDVLTHCRDATAKHVRGCWVIDGVLGKE